MPRDGIKSVVYKSFVSCDDPKGVVDCNTINISKICSHKMEQKIKSHRTSRNSSLSSASKAEKEEMRERFQGRSSVQLMEICREAKKLNQIVESWSKGLKSEDLAEDLLEGTLDLKESLIMLTKLQEVSKQSVRLKKEKCQRSSSHQLNGESCGSSVNGADEIKKVIKDSLVRRNATVGEKSCSCGMNYNSGSEFPSTSSSKSSIVNDHVNCRLVSTSPQKNSKRTNLIAKLMGLEEIPSRPMQTTAEKDSDCEKMSSYKRPSFDIDMPNARKSNSLVNKKVPEKVTLREILETVRSKGLIENDSNKELPHRHHSHNTCSNEWLKDAPPIVLIKPMRLPYHELEEYRARVSPEEEALNIKAVRRKLKMKGLQPFNDSDSDGGVLNSNKLLEKQEAEGISIKQITQNGRAQKHKEEVWESKKVVNDTKKKAAERLRTSSPVQNAPHEKKTIDKKVLTLKKVTAAANKKPLEKEIVKGKIVSRSQCQEKVTTTRSRKNKNPTLSKSIPDSASKRATGAIFNDCNNHRNDELLTCIVEGEKDDGSTDTNESAELPIMATPTTFGSFLTEMDECDTKIIECCPESPSFEVDARTVEVIDPSIHSETDIQSCNQGTNLKSLLLSSSSFLSHAEELFDLNMNHRTMLQASRCNNHEDPSTKPFIDCAIELVKCKCHQDLQVAHSLLLGYMSNSKIQIHIEKLVEEVCNDIEALISHRSICGENFLLDNLYAVLERDLCWRQMMNGMWDLGWKTGFSRNESEQVVNDIEKLILSGLVEESFI